jgi:hypothetical protein
MTKYTVGKNQSEETKKGNYIVKTETVYPKGMIVNTHALTIRTPNFMKQTLQY